MDITQEFIWKNAHIPTRSEWNLNWGFSMQAYFDIGTERVIHIILKSLYDIGKRLLTQHIEVYVQFYLKL